MSVLDTVVSQRFRFRFVTRGEKANALVVLAMKSLRRCHPNSGIVLIDANDIPVFDSAAAGVKGDLEILHIAPDEDEIAQAVGRGSRRHLFYWRHSPQVLAALPPSDGYAVYTDADIMFLRPMDLASLVKPLAIGRIAAAVDESSIDYYGRLGNLASALSGVLPAAGSGGPLLQAGLIFTNPADDGGFYDRFWELALAAARSGHIADLPFDDMCIVTALLGQGGPLWERLLPLGHEWNYITDAQKDPGVFGCAAHYGGHRAKALVLEQRDRLFPPGSAAECWGTVATRSVDGTSTLVRGPWHRRAARGSDEPLSVLLPFALSWLVPPWANSFTLSAVPQRTADVSFFVYVDGRLIDRIRADERGAQELIRLDRAEVVTVVGVNGSGDCKVHIYWPFAVHDQRRDVD